MISLNDFSVLLANNDLDAMLITSAPSLTYAAGMNGLEGVIFITKDKKAFCFTDSRYIEAAKKHTEPLGFDTSTVAGNNYFKQIGILCDSFGIQKLGFEEKYMTVAEYNSAKDSLPVELNPASGILSRLRERKSSFEASCIISAQRIAEKAFDTLLGEIRPGMTENECKARLEYHMACAGSENPGFSTILISGAKTSMPHGVPGDKVIEQGDFITFDFGAEVKGYKSDMTRTVAVGHATDEMKKVYDTVLEAQLAAIEIAAVGVEAKRVDKAARDVIAKAGYGEFFGHATGHGVGLEVHEGPRVSAKCSDVLENGNVITVEPGIYIPGKFGVRIEDMLYFEDNNKINMTKCAKKLIIL